MEHLDIVHVQCRELYLPVQYFESNHRYPVVYVQDEASVVLDSCNYLDHLFLTKQLPEIIFFGIKPHERNDEYLRLLRASGDIRQELLISASFGYDALCRIHSKLNVCQHWTTRCIYTGELEGVFSKTKQAHQARLEKGLVHTIPSSFRSDLLRQ